MMESQSLSERAGDHPVLSRKEVQAWMASAEQVSTQERPQMEIPSLIREAVRLSEVTLRLWDPTEARPGLRNAGPFLPSDLPQQIASLGDALSQVHEAFEETLLESTEVRDLWERGCHVLSELRAVLMWATEALSLDEPLPGLMDCHHDVSTLHELTEGLSALATTARSYMEMVQRMSAFDPALIEEADAIARQLQQRQRTLRRTQPVAHTLAVFRRRLAVLLQSRIRLVDHAARFVFRAHPSLRQEILADHPTRPDAGERRAVQVTLKRHERQYPRHLPLV